jgi:hypothetical protein
VPAPSAPPVTARWPGVSPQAAPPRQVPSPSKSQGFFGSLRSQVRDQRGAMRSCCHATSRPQGVADPKSKKEPAGFDIRRAHGRDPGRRAGDHLVGLSLAGPQRHRRRRSEQRAAARPTFWCWPSARPWKSARNRAHVAELGIDQLIFEFEAWTHIATAAEPRHQILSIGEPGSASASRPRMGHTAERTERRLACLASMGKSSMGQSARPNHSI